MNPEVTAQLLALPSLRKQAEADARAHHDSVAATHHGYARWDELPDYDATLDDDEPDYEGIRLVGSPRRIFAEARARLLADFARWQSQAWALRRIGELLGWDVGDVVPTIHRNESGPWRIRMVATNGDLFSRWAPCGEGLNRPEAIAAILLHLEGAQ